MAASTFEISCAKSDTRPADYLGLPPRVSLTVPPSIDRLIGFGEFPLRVPRNGRSSYPKDEYVIGDNIHETVKAAVLGVGLFSFVPQNRAYILTHESFVVRSHTLHGIANAMLAEYAVKYPTFDVIACWEFIIDLLIGYLGPRRTAALVWKIFDQTSVNVTQIDEDISFKLLAFCFPGLCKVEIASDDAVTLTITNSSILHSLLTQRAVEQGFLPDMGIENNNLTSPRFPGALSMRVISAPIGAIIQRACISVTGHHRWLCIDPALANIGEITAYDVERGLSQLGNLRGVRDPKIHVITSTDGKDLVAEASRVVLSSSGPLAVGIMIPGVTNGDLEMLRRYLFPYASIILVVGSNMGSLIDPRVSRFTTPPTRIIEEYPPYSIYYASSKDKVAVLQNTPKIVICNTQAYEKCIRDKHGFPITGENTHRVNMLVIDGTVEFDHKKLSNHAKEMLGLVSCVNVISDVDVSASWSSIFCKLLHYLKQPLFVKIS